MDKKSNSKTDLNRDIHGDLPGSDPVQVKTDRGLFDPPIILPDPKMIEFKKARAHVVLPMEGDHMVMEYVDDGIGKLAIKMHGARPRYRYVSDLRQARSSKEQEGHIGMISLEEANAIAKSINER